MDQDIAAQLAAIEQRLTAIEALIHKEADKSVSAVLLVVRENHAVLLDGQTQIGVLVDQHEFLKPQVLAVLRNLRAEQRTIHELLLRLVRCLVEQGRLPGGWENEAA